MLWARAGGIFLAISALIYLSTKVHNPSSHGPFDTYTSGNEKPSATLPVIVLVFLTRSGIQASEIWQAWYEDAEAFLRERHGRDVIDHLKGVVHYSRGLNISTVVVPQWLEAYRDPEPQNSRWGRLLNAMHRALSLALEWHPTGSYFIYLSDTTVPVKAFSTIFGAVMADSRSRADLYCDDHFGGNAKHGQWIMLKRDHAEILTNNSDWVNPRIHWIRGKCKTHAAAGDEYWPLKALRVFSGVEIGDFDKLVWFKSGKEAFYDMMESWTFVNWQTSERLKHYIGDYRRKPGHPARFDALQSRFLRLLVQMETPWFLRKTTDSTVVQDCYISLADYYLTVLGIINPEDRIHTKDCLLRDFLPALWKHQNGGRISISSLEN